MAGQTEVTGKHGVCVRLVALHRNARQPVREFAEPVTVLGSGCGCDLILASSSVDVSHAAIVRLGNAAYLCDLGAPGGTVLNGRRIRWARIAHRDVIELGTFRFGIELTEVQAAGTGEQPIFSLRSDESIGTVASIDPVLIVGSDPGCDVVLHHDSVAPRHTLVVWTEGGPVVRDLQRREATRLNGRGVDFARLMDGDAIGVGPFELLFETNTALPAPEEAEIAAAMAADAPELVELPTDSCDCTPLVSGHLDTLEHDPLDALWTEPFDLENADISGAAALDETPVSIEIGPVSDCEPTSPKKDSIRRETPSRPRTDGLVERESMDDFDCAETTASEAEDARNMMRAHMGQQPASEDETFGDTTVAEPCYAASENRSDEMSDEERSRFIEEQTRMLEQKKAELKIRVAAAQKALDERARKLKNGLDRRRQKLKGTEAELRRKADQLVEAAKEKHQEIETYAREEQSVLDQERHLLSEREAELVRRLEELDVVESIPETSKEIYAELVNGDDDRHADDSVDEVEVVDDIIWEDEDDFPTADFTNDITQNQSSSSTEGSLQGDFAKDLPSIQDPSELGQRATELAELVRYERSQIEEAENRLGALRFDIERLRASIQRSETRHQNHVEEVEQRSADLRQKEKDLEAEREPLLAKLRELDTRAATLHSSIDEVNTRRSELETEASQIAKSREEMEQREQDLRAALEKERHRLRVQQAELQHRAAELAKAARERRRTIEVRVAQRQAELERQAAELQAQREAIEDERRRELDTTIKELGQVTSARLSDVEVEVLNRQAELNNYMEAFGGAPDAASEVPEKPSSDQATPQPTEKKPALTGNKSISGGLNRLEALQSEIQALQSALFKSDNAESEDEKSLENERSSVSAGRRRVIRGGTSETINATLEDDKASFRVGAGAEMEGGEPSS